MRHDVLFATALLALSGLVSARPLLDGDADGVSDERDRCLYSPRGVTVGPDGCSNPGDEDEDGVPEAADACPLTPVDAFVDAQGCALDADVDGIADGVDVCPGTKLGSMVDARGCGAGERAVVIARRPPAPMPAPVKPEVKPAPAPAVPLVVPATVSLAPALAPRTAQVVSAPTPAIASPPVPAGAVAIGFAPYSAMLDAEGEVALQRFVAASTRSLLADADARVRVVGGIEPGETGAVALQLAESRAATVQARLTVLGLPRTRIERAQDRQSGARRVELSLVPG